jgi:hypothetical protein
VLVTPDLGDDVDGVIHKAQLDVSPVLDKVYVQGLMAAIPAFLPFAVRHRNHSLLRVDLICARLC